MTIGGLFTFLPDTANTDQLLLSPRFCFSNLNSEKVWKPATILLAFSF